LIKFFYGNLLLSHFMLKLPPRPELRLPDKSQVREAFRSRFLDRRSLLFPMLLVALAFHGALLAMPVPKKDAPKPADDKQNPIKVTQIPTEKPAIAETQASPKVNIPAIGTTGAPDAPSTADSSSTTGTAADTSTTASNSSASASSSSDSSASSASTSKTAKTGATSNATAAKLESKTAAEPSPSSEDRSAASADATAKPEDKTAEAKLPEQSTPATAASSGVSVAEQAKVEPPIVSFAEFPHYQPSTADCFGLGFGDNCRVVEKVAIADLTSYFRKELTAKGFKADLVTDTPTHKVFKVSKENKTLFLNIWQGKFLSYSLSDQILKRSPEELPKPQVKSEVPPAPANLRDLQSLQSGQNPDDLDSLPLDQVFSMLLDTLR
jgi:hypothetical protein